MVDSIKEINKLEPLLSEISLKLSFIICSLIITNKNLNFLQKIIYELQNHSFKNFNIQSIKDFLIFFHEAQSYNKNIYNLIEK